MIFLKVKLDFERIENGLKPIFANEPHMGVAVQKGAGQGILRGDGAIGQIGGGQSGQQAPQWQGGGALRRPTCPAGRHLAERGLVRHGQR